jgi:Raf kinase inhibitor-like YbhB/YbcL family protein
MTSDKGATNNISGDNTNSPDSSGFVPTEEELLEIVRYWTEQKIDIDWFSFNTGSTGGSEIRTCIHAEKRCADIAKTLGDEKVLGAVRDGYDRFGERNYGKLWQIFMKGPKDQYNLVWQEFDRCTNWGRDSGIPWAFAPQILLTSPSFKHAESIPEKYACRGDCCGQQISPPLAWSNVPANAESLAIIMDDLDGSDGPRAEWLIYNIPPQWRVMPENTPKLGELQDGILQGRNDCGKIGYHGPHRGLSRYEFNIYALDRVLDLKPGISKKELHQAMLGHILEEGDLAVIFK